MPYTLHRQNQSFTWTMPPSAPRRLSAAQVRQFDELGYITCEAVLSADELTVVVGAIDPLEAEAEAQLRKRANGRYGISRADEITFRPHLVLHSDVLAQLCRHPLLTDLCADLIGPDVRLYWDQSVYKKPGMAEEFPWHQDNGYTFVEPQHYLTCWIALTDATEANGCPWIAPGLHRLGTLHHESTALGFRCFAAVPNDAEHAAVPVPLRAGSMAVFSSLTPHRTGPNLTAHTRKAYIVQYAPEGARIRRADGAMETCAVGGRQYQVLCAGQPV